eukprot:TRINITY_DN19779_c0_g1_i1.p1 TRINITY_DN19779_c0_g1~~TRINITY_DN19779_c0_g1_i1.p1  ORF type:complete len:663 (+),score=155.30 TRINITY_DN19779_c0_g1_i1:161-2149(+)
MPGRASVAPGAPAPSRGSLKTPASEQDELQQKTAVQKARRTLSFNPVVEDDEALRNAVEEESKPQLHHKVLSVGMQAAMKECPVRTRNIKRDNSDATDLPGWSARAYAAVRKPDPKNDEDEDEGQVMGKYHSEVDSNDSSRHSSEIGRKKGPGLLRRATTQAVFEASVATAALRVMSGKAMRGETFGAGGEGQNMAALMGATGRGSPVLEEEGPSANALRHMHMEQSLHHLKEVFGLYDKEHQRSQLDILMENGLYFCGSQDPKMKQVGAAVSDAHNLSSSDDGSSEEEREQDLNADADAAALQKRAVVSVAEDLRELLKKTGGTSVNRRVPEEHEAVFDFAEARISMPRIIGDDTAGQLIAVTPKLNSDNSEGDVYLKTQVPRRTCTSGIYTSELSEIVDMKKLEEASITIVDEPPEPLIRKGARAPPSVKEWEAWREIQKQKRLEAKQAELLKMRGRGEEDTPGKRKPGADGSKERVPERNDVMVPRRAIRCDPSVGIVVENIPPPWDARPPPTNEDLEAALDELGVDPEVTKAAEGKPDLSDQEEDQFEHTPGHIRRHFQVRAIGRPFKCNVNMVVGPDREKIYEQDRTQVAKAGRLDTRFWKPFLVDLSQPLTWKERLFSLCGIDPAHTRAVTQKIKAANILKQRAKEASWEVVQQNG